MENTTLYNLMEARINLLRALQAIEDEIVKIKKGADSNKKRNADEN